MKNRPYLFFLIPILGFLIVSRGLSFPWWMFIGLFFIFRKQKFNDTGRRPSHKRRHAVPKRKSKARTKKKRNEPINFQATGAKKYKEEGLKLFKEYDYDGAILAFEKSLKEKMNQPIVHFNLACSYSLNENLDKVQHHLDLAVNYGFKDFEKIYNHDALAWFRIQPEFETIAANGFKNPRKKTSKEKISENKNLLDQLQKLEKLKNSGILNDDEFLLQKKKLLG